VARRPNVARRFDEECGGAPPFAAAFASGVDETEGARLSEAGLSTTVMTDTARMSPPLPRT